MRVAGCGLCCLTAEDGVDTEEAEDQALEVSEAGECRDTGPGQDTRGYTLYHGRSSAQLGDSEKVSLSNPFLTEQPQIFLTFSGTFCEDTCSSSTMCVTAGHQKN